MIKIIHTADIHLKVDEKAYGLATLQEIVELCTTENANFLLICGDMFDTYPDAEALRRDVAEIFANCKAEILYIPGNHEEHGKTGSLTNFDFGKLRPITTLPYSLFTRTIGTESIEFLAVPHCSSLDNWRDWGLPPPQKVFRIAMIHATVENMVYTGPDSAEMEEDGTILGSEFFTRNHIRYAALGHIHDKRELEQKQSLIAYPGSATVWRRKEEGPRSVNVIEIADQSIHMGKKILSSAGTYRSIQIPLSLESTLPDLDDTFLNCTPNDLLEICFTGIVENDHCLRDLTDKVLRYLSQQIRQPEINTDRVEVFSGLAQQPLAVTFLKTLLEHPPAGVKDEVISRARELTLLSIKRLLGGRS